MDQHIRLHHILRSAVIAVERAGERRPALPTALLAPTPDLATSIVATSAQSVEPLLNLLRYAYGLRHLGLFSLHDQGTQPDTFQDLLCYQLAAEAQELLSRGLHRRYERRHELLASPRGRIDFMQLAGRAGTVQSSLPCIHHPRLQDTLIDQVLLAGLQSAARLTHDLPCQSMSQVWARALSLLRLYNCCSVSASWHLLGYCLSNERRVIIRSITTQKGEHTHGPQPHLTAPDRRAET